MESLMQGSSRSVIGLSVVLLLLLSGCGAAYSGYMSPSLNQLEKGNYEEALNKLKAPSGKTNKLLYHLEKGLILHYQGQYEASNVEFAAAERVSDQLFTRSISRQVAAMVSNDAVIAYRGEEFELALIHYYRAMNYDRLGDRQAALVECRKANQKLEDYAQQAEYELSYKNDAFLQYMTGLFFESEGEWNDAYISYKDALKGYRAYEEAFGSPVPRILLVDLVRLADYLGYEDEVGEYVESYQLAPEELQPVSGGEIVVFVESGFVPRKHQIELNMPIMMPVEKAVRTAAERNEEHPEKGQTRTVAERAIHRYYHPHLYQQIGVDYWLRVALPEYREVQSQVAGVRLRAGNQSATAVMGEDLAAIAQQTFAEKFDSILRRTVVRNLVKYLASKGIEKAFTDDEDDEDDEDDKDGDDWIKEEVGKALGGLVNLLGVATEAADTRSWLSLPRTIHIARLSVPPGAATPTVEFIDVRGRVLAAEPLPEVAVADGAKVFLNVRTFR